MNIAMERIAFECLILKDYRLQNCEWFLKLDYVPHEVTVRIKYIDLEYICLYLTKRSIRMLQ